MVKILTKITAKCIGIPVVFGASTRAYKISENPITRLATSFSFRG